MTNPPTNNTTLPQGPYSYNSGITSTDPFINVYSLRNPLNVSDFNYAVQKRWVNFNTTPPSEWILESLPVIGSVQSAMWVQLGGPGSGTVLHLNVPLGSSPVFPDGTGGITYTSTGGTVAITGLTNTVNFDISGGTAIETITGDDSVAVTPTAGGTINLQGLVVANATHAKAVYTESPSAHLEKIDIQVSAAIVSTDVTKVGLAAFDSSIFTVDANGFVSLSGSGPGLTITGNTGGALSPSLGNWNILGAVTAAGSTPIKTSGLGSTLTVDVQRSQAIASTGSSKVGLAAFNSAQFTVDANGFVSLVGGGGGFNAINVQVFSGAGTYTYTPTANMAYAMVELVGSGGGGGGASNTGATTVSCSGGGGGGGYARKLVTAAAVGASQTVTIGAGGAGGMAGNNNGSPGNTTSFGSICSATGGSYGNGAPAATVCQQPGGIGGAGTGGDINVQGGNANPSFGIYTASGIGVNSGNGGPSFFGGAAFCRTLNSSNTAQAGYNGYPYGGGGSGASIGNSTGSGATGGNGSDGLCVVTEFIT